MSTSAHLLCSKQLGIANRAQGHRGESSSSWSLNRSWDFDAAAQLESERNTPRLWDTGVVKCGSDSCHCQVPPCDYNAPSEQVSSQSQSQVTNGNTDDAHYLTLLIVAFRYGLAIWGDTANIMDYGIVLFISLSNVRQLENKYESRASHEKLFRVCCVHFSSAYLLNAHKLTTRQKQLGPWKGPMKESFPDVCALCFLHTHTLDTAWLVTK